VPCALIRAGRDRCGAHSDRTTLVISIVIGFVVT
jgi:hypothetical protein